MAVLIGFILHDLDRFNGIELQEVDTDDEQPSACRHRPSKGMAANGDEYTPSPVEWR